MYFSLLVVFTLILLYLQKNLECSYHNISRNIILKKIPLWGKFVIHKSHLISTEVFTKASAV